MEKQPRIEKSGGWVVSELLTRRDVGGAAVVDISTIQRKLFYMKNLEINFFHCFWLFINLAQNLEHERLR